MAQKKMLENMWNVFAMSHIIHKISHFTGETKIKCVKNLCKCILHFGHWIPLTFFYRKIKKGNSVIGYLYAYFRLGK